MKKIPLTHKKFASVDDGDFDYLNQFKWHSKKDKNAFYAARGVWSNNRVKTIYMHRVILGDSVDGMECDHIDGNGLNNQRSNLRAVTTRQNQQNLHMKKSSRYPGVIKRKGNRGWQANILINGERKHLGLCKTEFAAFQTYVVACAILVGVP